MTLTLRHVLENITDPTHWVNPQTLMNLLEQIPSLRGFTYGYVSEYEFVRFLSRLDILDHYRDDDHKKTKSDRTFSHQGVSYSVQLKSLQTNSIRETAPGVFAAIVQNDASDRRRVILPNGHAIETTCYVVSEYDILAVSLQPFTGTWDFAFKKNKDLRRSMSRKYADEDKPFLLATTERITFPLDPSSGWSDDLHALLRDTDLGTVLHVDEETKIVEPPGTDDEIIVQDKPSRPAR